MSPVTLASALLGRTFSDLHESAAFPSHGVHREYLFGKMVCMNESRFKKTMKSNDTNNHRAPLSCSGDHKGLATRLAGVSRLLTYLNTRTLALLMFVGFGLLNTTHGKDAENNEAVAVTKNMEAVDNGDRGTSELLTEPTGQAISAALVLLQFTYRIVHAFTAALNEPSLIEYAKQQGNDIPDLQTTPCQGTERKTSNY